MSIILILNNSCSYNKLNVFESNHAIKELLMSYVLNNADSAAEIVVVTYSSNYDSLSAKHYKKAIKDPFCSLDFVSVVVLLRDSLLWNQLANIEDIGNIEYSLMTEGHQEILCKNCGFTAVVNLKSDTLSYVNYYVDPYAVCDHINNSINERKDYVKTDM